MLDPRLAQRGLQTGADEGVGAVFLKYRLKGIGPYRLVYFAAHGARAKERRVSRARNVTDVEDGLLPGPRSGKKTRGIGSGGVHAVEGHQAAVEVIILDVDQDQGSLGHVFVLLFFSLHARPSALRLALMTKTVPNAPKRVKIALLAYEGAQMSAVLGLGDILTVANRYAAEIDGLQVDHAVLHHSDLDSVSGFDAVVLPPNLTGGRGETDGTTHDWISDQHERGAVLCSACAGAFWLGHTGALDGRPVTTHWALEAEFRAAFPRAELHPEHLLIDDHDIVTAGGVMAWVDLGLFLVRRWMGPDVVSRTCRQMLIDPQGREQRNYRSFRPRLDHGDGPIRDLQYWVEKNAASELMLPALAFRVGMSKRTFQRRFAQATGLPVTRYVQELRIEKARGLLERTTIPVSEICWAVGYADVSAFSRLFRSICGVSASEYRRRFAVM